jgi:DNA repair exonuclease SbcCD ATPase subunit
MAKRGVSDHEKELEDWIRPELERHLAASEERIAAEVERRVLKRLSGVLDRLELGSRRRRRLAISGWLGFVAIITLSWLGWQSLEETRIQRAEISELRLLATKNSQDLQALQTELAELRARAGGYSHELAGLQNQLEDLRVLIVRSARELEELRVEVERLRTTPRDSSGSGSTGGPF